MMFIQYRECFSYAGAPASGPPHENTLIFKMLDGIVNVYSLFCFLAGGFTKIPTVNNSVDCVSTGI